MLEGAMIPQLIEVASGTLHTPDGDAHEVQGGAYLTPEGYLTTNAQLERARTQEVITNVPLVVGAALVGLAFGYWLGNRK
jgi:hypothetical protein